MDYSQTKPGLAFILWLGQNLSQYTVFKFQKSKNMKPYLSIFVICTITLFVSSQNPGKLNGITTGSIYLQTKDLSTPAISKSYTVNLNGNLGNSSLSYALALAGFQALKTQTQFTIIVSQVMFINSNTAMNLKMQFNPIASQTTTIWLKLKWTFLVVSSTFDQTYSNIWATNAELDPSLISVINLPIDLIGTAFLAVGGDVGDCDMFVDPLLQLDIPHCLAIPANGQYAGGKPIIHAYISGFSASAAAFTSGQSVSVVKGSNFSLYSDSQGWQILYSSPPNGPKVTIPAAAGGLTYIQISFLFVRMDYYALNYPLNSQLQYSSSHVFTTVTQYNNEVALSKGDKSSYNQYYFSLPDATYLIYGLSAFSFNSQTNSTLISVMVNMAKDNYWVISPSNSVQGVTISADMFIKNVMQLCNAKQKEDSLVGSISKSVIVPNLAAYTAVDVTQLVPLSELTSSVNPIVYRYGIVSSVNKQLVTFKSSFAFPLSSSGYLRLQLLVFEKSNMQSLVQNAQYNIKMSVGGEEVVSYKFLYHNTPNISFRSPAFKKAVNVMASSANVDITVSFLSSTTSQELYVLLAAASESVFYDPATSQCVSSCPSSASGVSAENFPLTCVYCKSQAGFVYSTLAATCVCKKTTYLNTATMSCIPCGVNCASCINPTTCKTCLGESQLVNGLCGCQTGQYLTAKGCISCPSECSSCIGPSGLCLSCRSNLQNIAQNCHCASGYFDSSINNCGACKANCLTCSQTNNCLSCNPNEYRILSNSNCVCKPGYYQSSIKVCQTCASTCLTCSSISSNCTSCDSTLNRVLSGGDCLCLAGFTETGVQCVMTNCSSNPLCAVCVSVSATQNVCIQCVANLHRVLNPITSQCECINGYFSLGGVCTPCGQGCQLCSSLTNCTSCATLATPQGDGTCLCPQTTYLALTADGVSYCQNCSPLCLSCQNSTFCSTCKSFTVISLGVCSCSIGYFVNSTANECQACGNNCSACNANGCINCASPFVLSQGSCKTNCTNGYHLQGNVCVPCVGNCSICLDQYRCANCQNSFFLFNGQCVSSCPPGTISFVNKQQIAVCQPCSSLCATCLNSPNFCTSCNNGTYLYMSTTNQTCLYTCPEGTLTDGKNCQPCDSSCAACGGSPSYCLKCSGSLFLYRGSCLQNCTGIVTSNLNGRECIDSCPEGSFLVVNGSCSPCNAQCGSCDITALNCTSCKVGVLADYGVCVISCASNQYIYGGVCYNCSSNCQQCFRRADYCVKCSPGLIISAGTCIHSCSSGQYYNSTIGLCMGCRRGCASCTSQNECVSCKNVNVAPVNGKCPFCPAPCLLCATDGRCLRCPPSTYLFNGACLPSCPGITVPINGVCSCSMGVLQDGACVSACASGSFNSNGICQLCDTNCLQCSVNGSNCVSCFFGWALNNGKCVAGTGCRYGQQLVNGQCSNICPNSTYFLQGVCYSDQCKDGYYPNGYGGCVRTWLYECSQGEYYYQGNCVSNCSLGLYGDSYSKQCLDCPSNCESCLSGFECFSCAANYTNVGGICYFSGCTVGYVSVGSSCVNSCPDGTKKQGSICIRRCAEGSYFYNDFCYLVCPTSSNNGYACTQGVEAQ